MQKKKRVLLIVFATAALLLLIITSLILLMNNTKISKYTYLEGTVTAYDPTPASYDGSIIFSVDHVDVDIGGGLRGNQPWGDVDHPLQVGDKVKAKLIKSEHGSLLTVYDCSECYVKKVK